MLEAQNPLFECCQISEVGLRCSIDLTELFPISEARENFKGRLQNFKRYAITAEKLIYDSEQLVPAKKDSRPPVLFVLGNPATHSIERGMFFTSEGKNGGEHRFWKNILPPAGIEDFDFKGLPESRRNEKRRRALLELDYKAKYRIGLCVFISFPSDASGAYSGIQGVRRLFGSQAFSELVKYERKRILALIREFVTPNGAVFTFQSDAWNHLRGGQYSDYDISKAKAKQLEGTVAEMPGIRIFGLPPTRLSGPAGKALKKFLSRLA
jgi:hypothetical protein